MIPCGSNSCTLRLILHTSLASVISHGSWLNMIFLSQVANVSSWQLCQAECAANSRCQAWNWRDPEFSPSPNCYIGYGIYGTESSSFFLSCSSGRCEGTVSDRVILCCEAENENFGRRAASSPLRSCFGRRATSSPLRRCFGKRAASSPLLHCFGK